MRDVAPSLVAALEEAVRAERAALAALSAAREVHQRAMARTTEVAAELQAAGIPMTRIALVVAREIGLPASVAARRRLAARLRQRTARRRVTASHADHAGSPPVACHGSLPSSMAVHERESHMPKLIKKTTVTEEFVEQSTRRATKGGGAAESEPDEDLDDLADFDDDEQDDDEPTKRRRRR